MTVSSNTICHEVSREVANLLTDPDILFDHLRNHTYKGVLELTPHTGYPFDRCRVSEVHCSETVVNLANILAENTGTEIIFFHVPESSTKDAFQHTFGLLNLHGLQGDDNVYFYAVFYGAVQAALGAVQVAPGAVQAAPGAVQAAPGAVQAAPGAVSALFDTFNDGQNNYRNYLLLERALVDQANIFKHLQPLFVMGQNLQSSELANNCSFDVGDDNLTKKMKIILRTLYTTRNLYAHLSTDINSGQLALCFLWSLHELLLKFNLDLSLSQAKQVLQRADTAIGLLMRGKIIVTTGRVNFSTLDVATLPEMTVDTVPAGNHQAMFIRPATLYQYMVDCCDEQATKNAARENPIADFLAKTPSYKISIVLKDFLRHLNIHTYDRDSAWRMYVLGHGRKYLVLRACNYAFDLHFDGTTVKISFF